MARMRLFAALRDSAGTGEVLVEAVTVGGAIAEAGQRFGPGFAAGVATARIWVNGNEASIDDPLGPDDEIALLPPVSGGSANTVSVSGVVVSVIALAVIVLNQFDDPWWTAALVALVGAWVVDVVSTVTRRGRDLAAGPILLSVLGTMVVVHLFGFDGMALAAVLAVILPMVWAVMSDNSRMLTILGPMVLVALIASNALGSMMLARRWQEMGSTGLAVILSGMVVGTAAGSLVPRFTRSAWGDPIMVTGISALLATLVAAAMLDQDLITYALVGAALSFAMVIGRGFGSVIRIRVVRLTEVPAGMLALLDGPMFATAVVLMVFRLFA